MYIFLLCDEEKIPIYLFYELFEALEKRKSYPYLRLLRLRVSSDCSVKTMEL